MNFILLLIMKYLCVLLLTLLSLAVTKRGSYSIYQIVQDDIHRIALGKTVHIHAPCHIGIGQQTFFVSEPQLLKTLSFEGDNQYNLENTENAIGAKSVCRFDFTTKATGIEKLTFELNYRGDVSTFVVKISVSDEEDLTEGPIFENEDEPMEFSLGRSQPLKFLGSEKGLNKQVINSQRPFTVKSAYNASARTGHRLNVSTSDATLLVKIVDQPERLLLGATDQVTDIFTTVALGDYKINYDYYSQGEKTEVSLRLHTY